MGMLESLGALGVQGDMRVGAMWSKGFRQWGLEVFMRSFRVDNPVSVHLCSA